MRKIIKRTKVTIEPVSVNVSLQDIVDLNWALYISRINEVVTYQNAKSRGDDAACDMALDELKCISRADSIVNGLFDQIMSSKEAIEDAVTD